LNLDPSPSYLIHRKIITTFLDGFSYSSRCFRRVRKPLVEADWATVIKLFTMWEMGDLRKLTISKLDTPSLSSAWRVALGRKHGIVDWVRSGYIALAAPHKTLSSEDFELLGIQSALNLSQEIRKCYNKAEYGPRIHKSPRKPRSASSVESSEEAVSRVFEKEFQEQSTTLGNVDRILLAHKYGVSEWLHAEYVQLAERDEDLTLTSLWKRLKNLDRRRFPESVRYESRSGISLI
jgi:hypothetical protein